jgi:SMI1-KNR4 cell-wall
MEKYEDLGRTEKAIELHIQMNEIVPSQSVEQLVSALRTKSGPSLTDAEVRDYEKLLAITFPDSYRKFLRQFGNIAGSGIFGSSRSPWPSQVSVVSETLELRSWYPETFGHNLLPICADGRGNYWCLVCDGQDIGKVIFWQYDLTPAQTYPNAPSDEALFFWVDGANFDDWLIKYLTRALHDVQERKRRRH